MTIQIQDITELLTDLKEKEATTIIGGSPTLPLPPPDVLRFLAAIALTLNFRL